jgi:hypothetical protein
MMLGKCLVLMLIGSQSSAFTAHSTCNRLHGNVRSSTSSSLFMGKAKNSQAELAKKMALAKQQREDDDKTNPAKKTRLSDEEIKKQNDRLRFEELLRAGGSVSNDISGHNYLTEEQEEAQITAIRSGAKMLFPGDPAPTQCFEELVSIKSENSIGKGGATRLVPWLRKNELRRDEYLIIVSDPRMKSPELRETMKAMMAELPKEIQSRLIIVNADSPSENRRWIKQNGEIDIYSDEKLEWMQAYTALGEKRWSISIFMVADERIHKLARDVDSFFATQTITTMVTSFQS